MFGFFIGTACLLGFVALARRGRHHCGHGGWHRGPRGFGGRFMLNRILSRLDTTPGQEKVIRESVADFKEEAWDLREDLRGTRSELAQALRAPELDKAALDRVFVKHDELIEKLRASFTRATEQIHTTLDERQRKQLADMIEAGPWGYAGC